MEKLNFFESMEEQNNFMDQLAKFFLEMKPGSRIPVCKLTSKPEKFIYAALELMETWAFNRIIQFNIDKTEIRKNLKPIEL